MADDITNDAERRASRAETALEEMTAERNRLWEELHRRTAQDRELEHYRETVGHMRGSLSWRITAPLRAAKWFVALAPEMYARVRRFLAHHPRTNV